MHVLTSMVNEDTEYERRNVWISTLSVIFSHIDWAPYWSQPVRDNKETEQQFPQHRKKKQTKKTKQKPIKPKNYHHQSRVLHRRLGEERGGCGDRKPGGYTEHVREIQRYLWLDGRMDGHMTTCTQRATSHKCSILFSNDTLWARVSSHFGPLGSLAFWAANWGLWEPAWEALWSMSLILLVSPQTWNRGRLICCIYEIGLGVCGTGRNKILVAEV